MAFHEHWDCQLGDHGLDKGPGDRAGVGGFGGVAVKCRGDGVGSGAFGGDGVFEGGDVGQDGEIEFGVDAAD